MNTIKGASCNPMYSKVGAGPYSADSPPSTPSRSGIARGDSNNTTPIYSPEVLKRCLFPGGINSPHKLKDPVTPETKISRYAPEAKAVTKLGFAGDAVDGAETFFGKGDTFFETCCSHTHLIHDLVLPDGKGGVEWRKIPKGMVKILVMSDIYGSRISNAGNFKPKGKWFTLNQEVVANYEVGYAPPPSPAPFSDAADRTAANNLAQDFKLALIKQGLRSAFSVILQNRTCTDTSVPERWEKLVSGLSSVVVLDRTHMHVDPTAMCDFDAKSTPQATWTSLPSRSQKEKMAEWADESLTGDFKPRADIWGNDLDAK